MAKNESANCVYAGMDDCICPVSLNCMYLRVRNMKNGVT